MEKRKQIIPNNTPVFVLGNVRRKNGIAIGFNGEKYMIEYDDGEVIERTEEYLIPIPRKLRAELRRNQNGRN